MLAVQSVSSIAFLECMVPNAEFQGLSLHYEISGLTTGPWIVLAHALGADLHMWDEVIPHLENNFRVLRYDARGHGLSTLPPLPYSIEQLGSDLLNMLDWLSVERVYLCGLSLGGLVGLWLSIHAPQRIVKLVLANTAARIGTREGWNARISDVLALGMAPLAQLALGRWFTPQYRMEHPEEMNRIREMIERTSPQGYIGCCGVLRDTDLRSQLTAVETACLVITGREDPATPPQDGLALHAGLRNSHLSAWEQSARFASSILDFFSRKGARQWMRASATNQEWGSAAACSVMHTSTVPKDRRMLSMKNFRASSLATRGVKSGRDPVSLVIREVC
jgi:3-oxoadipate enol-lactonase